MANRVVDILYQLKDKFSGQVGKITGAYRKTGDAAEQASERIERSNKRASGSFAAIGTKAKLAALAAVAAVAGLVRGISAWTEAAAIQERAETKLETSLRNLSGATQEQIDALKAQAAALQVTTGYGDEATISAQAMLATFQLNAEQIGELTPRLLDMAEASRKTGASQVDLETISIALGKAMTSGIGSLSRYGIAMSDAQKEAFKLADQGGKVAILAEVLDGNFKGLAETVGGKYDGAVRRASANQGDFLETLGQQFTQNEQFVEQSNVVADTWNQLAALIKENTKEIGAVISVFSRTLTGAFAGIRLAWNGLAAIIKVGSAGILQGLAVLTDGLSAITFGDVSKAFELAAADMRKYSRELVDSLEQDGKDVEAALRQLGKAYGAADDSAKQVKQAVEDGKKAAAGAADINVGGTIAANEKAANKALKDELKAREGVLRDHVGAVKRLQDEQIAIGKEFSDLVSTAQGAGGVGDESATFLDAAIAKGRADAALARGNYETAIDAAREAGEMVRDLADEGEVSSLVLTGLAKQIERVANAAQSSRVEGALIDEGKARQAVEIVEEEIAKANPKLGGVDALAAAERAAREVRETIEARLAAQPPRVAVAVDIGAIDTSNENLKRGIK